MQNKLGVYYAYLATSDTVDWLASLERAKAAAMLPLAADKVAAETKRIADIQNRLALAPAWLDGALRAAGVIRDGETL